MSSQPLGRLPTLAEARSTSGLEVTRLEALDECLPGNRPHGLVAVRLDVDVVCRNDLLDARVDDLQKLIAPDFLEALVCQLGVCRLCPIPAPR